VQHPAEVKGVGDGGKTDGFAPLVDRVDSFFEPVLPIGVKWFKDDILALQPKLS
jgi:hypothetical protein